MATFKGQLISKANCQAVDSPKKRNKQICFFDLKSCYVVKSNAICAFFWRIYGLTIRFRNKLTFSNVSQPLEFQLTDKFFKGKIVKIIISKDQLD